MAMFPALLSARRYPLNYAGKEVEPRGSRTPDLRREKAARHFAGSFWSLQKSCKNVHFDIDAFPELPGYLLGLLHGCCTLLPVVGASGYGRPVYHFVEVLLPSPYSLKHKKGV
jgi:hypothetical protein